VPKFAVSKQGSSHLAYFADRKIMGQFFKEFEIEKLIPNYAMWFQVVSCRAKGELRFLNPRQTRRPATTCDHIAAMSRIFG
jgi:hypothetical protein